MIVDLILTASDEPAQKSLHSLIEILSDFIPNSEDLLVQMREGQRLASAIALIAVERALPQGSNHESRAGFLLETCNGDCVHGMVFSGTIGRFDFRKVEFRHCSFEQVTFANCKFDETSSFRECRFTGPPFLAHTQGLGAAQFIDCVLDAEATAVINAAKVNDGKRQYTSDDLRNDIGSVIGKFIIKGGIGLKSVQDQHLLRGTISSSRYREDILDAIRVSIIQPHHISGKSREGFNVIPTAEGAVKFYASNNVFTGPLRDVFERLQKKLHLK